jgi:hypothetical protein
MARRKRTCRVCGCTEDDCRECIELTGGPCSWAEKDLCSACVPHQVNLLKRGYVVMLSTTERMGTFATNGPAPAMQIFDDKAAAEDLRDLSRYRGHPFARVVEVTYTVKSDGLPVRPCNKGTHTKKAK